MRFAALAPSLPALALVLILIRQTIPWRPWSLTCLKPRRWNEKKLVTNSFLLFLVTARPRGWKWRFGLRLQALPRSGRLLLGHLPLTEGGEAQRKLDPSLRGLERRPAALEAIDRVLQQDPRLLVVTGRRRELPLGQFA